VGKKKTMGVEALVSVVSRIRPGNRFHVTFADMELSEMMGIGLARNLAGICDQGSIMEIDGDGRDRFELAIHNGTFRGNTRYVFKALEKFDPHLFIHAAVETRLVERIRKF